MIQESLMSETERVYVTFDRYAKITKVTYYDHNLFAVTSMRNVRNGYYISPTAHLIGGVYKPYAFNANEADLHNRVDSCEIFCRSDACDSDSVRFDLLADSVDEKHKMLVSWTKEILLEQLITYDI